MRGARDRLRHGPIPAARKPLINRKNMATRQARRLAGCGWTCYITNMIASLENSLPTELASELEKRFFWWEPVGSQPRSNARILAQAMNFAFFTDVRRL